MIETDVAIVGAGPGGAAASLYLSRRGIRSVIVEKEEFPRYHIGESLTGEVGQRLRDLGLEEYMIAADHPKKFGVDVYGPAGNQTFHVPVMERTGESSLRAGQTWQVRRDLFDKRMLEEACSRGATLVRGKASGVIREGAGVRGVLVNADSGEEVTVGSRVVIDASGPATFLQSCGVTSAKRRGNYDKQLAVYSQLAGGVRNEGKGRDNTLILYKSANHWAWFIPLSDESVSVGVVVQSEYFKSRKESLDEFFLREIHEINPELERRTPDPVLLEEVRASSNYSYAIDDYVGDGFLCVGDAHRFIDPVFSFGMHLAVHEAELAADHIARHFDSGKAMAADTFADYQRTCDLGMNAVQDLVDAFWNNPHAFAYAAHYKYRDDVIDLFAGRIYEDRASAGLVALQKINEKARQEGGAAA